jgi:hypothetical protein
MRHSKEVREQVLVDEGPFEEVEDNLEVKELTVGGRRYIVCR